MSEGATMGRHAPSGQRLSRAGFSGLFSSFGASAFRLETLPAYRVESEADELALFLQGKPLPPDGNEAWAQIVTKAVAAGKRMQRVHVVPRRLTPYLRFEIEWGYLYSAEAGEEILLLTHDTPGDLFGTWPLHDFWVFDDHVFVRMHYAEDGRFLYAATVEDGGEVEAYRRAQAIAVAHAVPLQRYLAEVRGS